MMLGCLFILISRLLDTRVLNLLRWLNKLRAQHYPCRIFTSFRNLFRAKILFDQSSNVKNKYNFSRFSLSAYRTWYFVGFFRYQFCTSCFQCNKFSSLYCRKVRIVMSCYVKLYSLKHYSFSNKIDILNKKQKSR